jgi:hypothetical protein
MENNDDPLAKFKGILPSRAELSMLALYGPSEAARQAADALLKILPPMQSKERAAWATEMWTAAKLPSESHMEKSPIGRQTLVMLRANQPVAAEKPDATVAPVDPEPATPAESIPAKPEQLPDDGVNEYLKKLDWPPKPSPPPKPLEDDGIPHKWQAARPSPPDTSLKPLASDDFANNQPIY